MQIEGQAEGPVGAWRVRIVLTIRNGGIGRHTWLPAWVGGRPKGMVARAGQSGVIDVAGDSGGTLGCRSRHGMYCILKWGELGGGGGAGDSTVESLEMPLEAGGK